MKFMGATCLSEELYRPLKKKKKKKKKKNAWVSSESSRFAYIVFTGSFSYFNMQSNGSVHALYLNSKCDDCSSTTGRGVAVALWRYIYISYIQNNMTACTLHDQHQSNMYIQV